MRFLGHPVHPIVVAFPIALLVLTPLWDAAQHFGVARLALVAYWTEVAGLIGGALAAVTGLADFLGLKEPSQKLTDTALRHAGFAFTTLGLFVGAFVARGGPSGEPGLLVIGLELIGALGLGVTGWLGGQLVFGHGVGVSRGKER